MSAAKLVHNAICFGSHGGSRSFDGYVADRYEARAVIKAYLISDVTVRDPAAFEVYRARAAASIKAFGGRYLVRGGEISTLEGESRPSALVIIEFIDTETAKRWYASPEYASALEVRDQALTRNLIPVDGVKVG